MIDAKKRLFGLVLLVMLLSGCTMKLMYPYIDWWAMWTIGDYFDLSDEQEEFLEAQLEDHLDWHRTVELANYEKLLEEAKERIKDGISPDDLDWADGQVALLRKNLVTRLAPDTATFLKKLDSEQIDFLETKIPEFNERIKERMAMKPEDRREQRAEDTVERIEEWVGFFTEEQRQTMYDMSLKFPLAMKERLEYREASQQAFIAFLKEGQSVEALEEKLIFWLSDPKNVYTPAYAEKVRQSQKLIRSMIYELDKSMSPEQRKYLTKRLDSFLEDLESMKNS